jgi:hypothetical protein
MNMFEEVIISKQRVEHVQLKGKLIYSVKIHYD